MGDLTGDLDLRATNEEEKSTQFLILQLYPLPQTPKILKSGPMGG